MSKQMKFGLLPAAIAGALLSGNAFAGTEACFEVYKDSDNAGIVAFDAVYGNSSCVIEASRGSASATDLESTTEGKIAYELTGNLPVDFDKLDTVNTDLNIVYIPTTDIPGGTKIQMELTGAVFSGNANQIHLVKDEDGSGPNTNFIAVASSDGALDGTNKITFLTKAGTTISAGTRLAYSLVSTGASSADVEPVKVLINNDTCTEGDTNTQVTIAATYAKTDGGTGYNIQGAVSQVIGNGFYQQLVLDTSAQFYSFYDAANASEALVNAESFDNATPVNEIIARTQFVYDADAANQLVVKKSEVIYPADFYNRAGGDLDQAVVLTAGDYLESTFSATNTGTMTETNPGANMRVALWNARTAADGTLIAQEEAETGRYFAELNDSHTYETLATDIFTPEASTGDAEPNTQVGATNKLVGADYNKMYYVLTNLTDGVMNFNYDVNVAHELTFNDTNYNNHCGATEKTHTIGVNGAVLKVPYMYNSESSFVRITNEHTEMAEVSVEVFDENDDANDVKTFTIGTVGATSSAVFFAPEIIATYADKVGRDVSKRVSMTFTVTSPKDTVHGEAVLVVPGKTDRVMSVLDQNNWNQ